MEPPGGTRAATIAVSAVPTDKEQESMGVRGAAAIWTVELFDTEQESMQQSFSELTPTACEQGPVFG